MECTGCKSSYTRHILNILTRDYKKCKFCKRNFCSPCFVLHYREKYDTNSTLPAKNTCYNLVLYERFRKLLLNKKLSEYIRKDIIFYDPADFLNRINISV